MGFLDLKAELRLRGKAKQLGQNVSHVISAANLSPDRLPRDGERLSACTGRLGKPLEDTGRYMRKAKEKLQKILGSKKS